MLICLKHRYPFRLATTSFIHRSGYCENVSSLAPFVDEIELLFLERDHLPSQQEIRELKRLGHELDITYNVHLPMDISLAHPSPEIRRRSIEAVLEALALAAPLNATGHVLHLTFEEADTDEHAIRQWQRTAVKSLSQLLNRAPDALGSLCVETLNFPPRWLWPVVEPLNLAVCVDVGHVIHHGYDLQDTLNLFNRHIGMFHLHGVSGGQDHCALNHLQVDTLDMVARFLLQFDGSVSLEVFSYQDLEDSMACFNDMTTRLSGRSSGHIS